MPVFEAPHAKPICFLLQPKQLPRIYMKNARCLENGDDPVMAMLAARRGALPRNLVKNGSVMQRQFTCKSTAGAHDLANKVFEFSREGILIADSENNILSVNRAFTEITGYSAEDVVGKKSCFLYPCGEDAAAFSGLQENILANGYWQGEIWGRRKNGELFPEWLTISTATEETGEITHYISSFSDVTEQKRAASRFEYLAHHDSLTGLPNRVLFDERLTAAISLAYRHGKSLGLLYIDLDNFKQINDTLGHGCGDQLLKQVAGRLGQCIRESDAVGRMGGDEFVILLNDLSDRRSVEEVARKILHLLQAPFYLSAQKSVISASIGIALFPEHGTDNATLLEKADAAMYQAKFGPYREYRISLPPPA